ncbi:MAG: GNAT family N-acetyltransferase [Bacillota bacterium]
MKENPASGRVMEKVGMRKEGILREHGFRWGEYKDLIQYGILENEFEK